MARARAWCFTVNNYTPACVAAVRAMESKCKWIICGQEQGESGTPHLQGYLVLKSARTLGAMSKDLPRAYLVPAKGTWEQNLAYCSKEKVLFELGTRPLTVAEQGAKGAEYWATQLSLAKAGRVEDCDAKLQITHHNALHSIAVRYGPKPQSDDWQITPHEWYYGPTGAGKTKKALDENPGAYLKNCDQWWQGYNGEDVVVIDDLDKYHLKLGYYLKRWADHSPFTAEIKGSSLVIRPKKIIVTSNYSPEEIWDDPNTLGPIRRRFRVVHFSGVAQSQPASLGGSSSHSRSPNIQEAATMAYDSTYYVPSSAAPTPFRLPRESPY